MITILVDIRENKTPALMDQYLHDHPLIAKDLLVLNNMMEIGDMAGNNQLFEIKWGQDLYSSLNSNHLKDQLLRMRAFAEPKGIICHLVLADTDGYIITLKDYKRAVQIAQECGCWIHHKQSITAGIECIIHYIRNPPQPIVLNLPVSNTKKSPFLIRVLSQIDGVSPEFAEFAISEQWSTITDLYNAELSYWDGCIQMFYKKNMGSLLDKILKAIG